MLWAFKARYNVMYATRVLWDGAEHPRAAWTRVKRALLASLEGKKKVSREWNNLLSNVREGRKK